MLSIIKGPYLQMPSIKGITVLWETSIQSSSKVMVYPVGFMNDQSRRPITIEEPMIFEGNEDVCIHKVKITGLDKGTPYHYKVISAMENQSIESQINIFATAVEEGIPFSFAVTAETGGYGDTGISRKIFKQMKAYRPDLLLMLGDVVDNGTVYNDWAKFFFSPAEDVLVNTPYYACLGNHEYNSEWFYAFNDFPTPKNYYSFDYGDAHFVCLDSTALVDADTPYNNKMQAGEPQFDFLIDDLQKAKANWKVIFFHYPPYISADFEIPAMRALCPIFEKHGVNLVFSSHTIVYERSHPITQDRLDEKYGVNYIVCGGAGSMPEWFRSKRQWHTAQALAIPHFLQILVTPCTLELVAIDYEGRQFDRLKLHKHDRKVVK